MLDFQTPPSNRKNCSGWRPLSIPLSCLAALFSLSCLAALFSLSLTHSLPLFPQHTTKHKQLPEPGNGGGGPGGAISSLFRSLAGKGGEPSNVASASSSSAVGPAVSTDNSLASGKDPPLARSDAFQSSANAGKLLGGGTFPETGDPTTGNQVPVPATLSSKAQTAAPADWVPPASGQLAPRDANYDAESSTLSTAQAKQDKVLNGVALGSAKAKAEEAEEVARGGSTSALAAAASGLLGESPRSSSSASSPAASPLDATGTKSFKSAKPAQLAKLVAPAGPNSQAASWPNATQPQPAPGVVPTLRSQDPSIAALDRAQGVPPVPATSVLSDGSIAGGNANYGKQVDVSIVANLSYPGTGLKGEKVTVREREFLFLCFSFFRTTTTATKERTKKKLTPHLSPSSLNKKNKNKTGLPLPFPDLPGHGSRPLHRETPVLTAAGGRPAPGLCGRKRL